MATTLTIPHLRRLLIEGRVKRERWGPGRSMVWNTVHALISVDRVTLKIGPSDIGHTIRVTDGTVILPAGYIITE